MAWGKPEFFDSEYFYYDKNDRPALKEGAPKKEVEELSEFLEAHYGKDEGIN